MADGIDFLIVCVIKVCGKKVERCNTRTITLRFHTELIESNELLAQGKSIPHAKHCRSCYEYIKHNTNIPRGRFRVMRFGSNPRATNERVQGLHKQTNVPGPGGRKHLLPGALHVRRRDCCICHVPNIDHDKVTRTGGLESFVPTPCGLRQASLDGKVEKALILTC